MSEALQNKEKHMIKTYIVNAQVYTGHLFVKRTICIENGKIKLAGAEDAIDDMCLCGACEENVRIINAEGLRAVPGFIDIHTHGAAGFDINASNAYELGKIAEFFAEHGTTSWLASILTDTQERTENIIRACNERMKMQADEQEAGMAHIASELLGMHLEGPFLADEYKGAMPGELLCEPNSTLLMHYQNAAAGAIKYITIAPELAGAAELVGTARSLGMTVGIGHSGASYEQAMAAIAAGASVGTHVGNAMKLCHQHEPAIFGALLESDSCCEIIADGRHLHPGFVRMLLQAKGTECLIAISDSIMAAGLADGKYKLGINDVIVKDGDAKLADDGTRAGSTLTLDNALKNIMAFTGLALEKVLPMLTENPARAVGVFDRKGSIDDGKDADIVLLDNDNNICHVFVCGRQL